MSSSAEGKKLGTWHSVDVLTKAGRGGKKCGLKKNVRNGPVFTDQNKDQSLCDIRDLVNVKLISPTLSIRTVLVGSADRALEKCFR